MLRGKDSKSSRPPPSGPGYLINPIQTDVIRLAPPLILGHDDAARFVATLPAALEGS